MERIVKSIRSVYMPLHGKWMITNKGSPSLNNDFNLSSNNSHLMFPNEFIANLAILEISSGRKDYPIVHKLLLRKYLTSDNDDIFRLIFSNVLTIWRSARKVLLNQFLNI